MYKRVRLDNPFLQMGGFENDFVKMLLPHMSIHDAFNASQVCKRWYDAIKGADEYWSRQCTSLWDLAYFVRKLRSSWNIEYCRKMTFYNFNSNKKQQKKFLFAMFTEYTPYRPLMAVVLSYYLLGIRQKITYWNLRREHVKHPTAEADKQSFAIEVAIGTPDVIHFFFCHTIGILKRINWNSWELISISDFLRPWVQRVSL